jgi:hypothetical protein
MQTTIVILGLILALMAFINSAMHLNETEGGTRDKAKAKAKPQPDLQVRARQSTRAAGTSVSL